MFYSFSAKEFVKVFRWQLRDFAVKGKGIEDIVKVNYLWQVVLMIVAILIKEVEIDT